MKQTLLIIIAFAVFLQSCAPSLTIPSDLSKSLLLVEKLPTDSVQINAKGKKEVVDRKVGGWESMLNRRQNTKVQKIFASYPFAYRIVSAEEVGDNIDPNKTTYVLKNGTTVFKTKLMTGNAAHGGAPREVRVPKTKVVLENLTKGRKSVLGELQGGVSGIAGKFVKAAMKIKKSQHGGKSKRK